MISRNFYFGFFSTRLRIFTHGPFSIYKGMLELDALPRVGDSLLARDPDGPLFYKVRDVLHVKGSLPIAMVDLTEGERFDGLDLEATGLAPERALRPLGGLQSFLGWAGRAELETPRLGLG